MTYFPGLTNVGLDTQLTSNNSTYRTKTGGTHTSNVRHANTNTDHTSKTFKKGTVDLANANSNRVAGGAGGTAGPSRSAAGAAGGLAAGGHGGTGGQVIIHHQAPTPAPDKMTSAELLGAAIGSTIVVILIIIAGAITCRSVYRDQSRSFKKRRDKKAAKKAHKDTESASVTSRSEELERLTSVLPDVTVPPAQQGAPHRRATEMLRSLTPLSQTYAADSTRETIVQPAPAPSAPPPALRSVQCPRRHVSSNSDSDMSPIPHRDPRQARAWGPYRSKSRHRDMSSRDTSTAYCFPLSTAIRPADSTGRGPNLSSTLIHRAPATGPSPSSPTTVIGQMTRTSGTATSGCSCPTGMPPAPYCSSELTPSSIGIGQPSQSTLPMNGGQGTGTELHGQGHRQYQHLNQTIDTQQQLIGQLLQAQKMMSVSLPSMRRSSTTAPLEIQDNPHQSLHTASERTPTRRVQELPPSKSTSAATTELPPTPEDDEDDK